MFFFFEYEVFWKNIVIEAVFMKTKMNNECNINLHENSPNETQRPYSLKFFNESKQLWNFSFYFLHTFKCFGLIFSLRNKIKSEWAKRVL